MTIKGNFRLKNRTALTAGFVPWRSLCSALRWYLFGPVEMKALAVLRNVGIRLPCDAALGPVVLCCGGLAQCCCCGRRFIRRLTQASVPPGAKMRVHGVRTVHCDVSVGLSVTVERKNRTDALCGVDSKCAGQRMFYFFFPSFFLSWWICLYFLGIFCYLSFSIVLTIHCIVVVCNFHLTPDDTPVHTVLPDDWFPSISYGRRFPFFLFSLLSFLLSCICPCPVLISFFLFLLFSSLFFIFVLSLIVCHILVRSFPTFPEERAPAFRTLNSVSPTDLHSTVVCLLYSNPLLHNSSEKNNFLVDIGLPVT